MQVAQIIVEIQSVKEVFAARAEGGDKTY